MGERFKVMFCPNCEKVWERIGKFDRYHKGFPTYGLQRKNCRNCSGVEK